MHSWINAHRKARLLAKPINEPSEAETPRLFRYRQSLTIGLTGIAATERVRISKNDSGSHCGKPGNFLVNQAT